MSHTTKRRFQCWIIACFVLLCTQRYAYAGDNATAVDASRRVTALSQHFVENKGRVYDTDGKRRDDILYTASVGNARLFFGRNSISYVLVSADTRTLLADNELVSAVPLRAADRHRPQFDKVTMHRVDIEFEGISHSVDVQAGERSSSTVRYFNTPDGRSSEAAEFGTLTYHNVYDNVNIVFRIENGRLKYDFVVLPGGQASTIRLRYNGAERVAVRDDGTLAVHTPLGDIIERIPAAFTTDDRNRKSDVPVVFHQEDANVISFRHDRYDVNQSLTIDPAVEVSSFLGGSDLDKVTNIGRHNSNYEFYAMGYTLSVDFPVSPGAYQSTNGGNEDAFIFKMDENGNRLWATYYGGSGSDVANALYYDTNNDIVVVGGTESTNLPGVSLTSFQSANAGGRDAYIAKFDGSGSLLWATYYGGSSNDEATGVYINGSLQVYVTGWTSSVKTGAGAFPVNLAIPAGLAGFDGFLLKFASTGTRQFARRFGGDNDDLPTDMIARNVDIVVVGQTTSTGTGFSPSTTGSLQGNNAGSYDIFLSKFNNISLTPVRTTLFGGDDVDWEPSITEGSNTDILVSFTTYSANVPVTALAIQSAKASSSDAFIATFAYSLDNTSLIFASYFGGDGTDEGRGIAYSALTGMTFLTGSTASSDLPVTSPALFPGHPAPCSMFDQDGFLLQLSPQSSIVACSYFGGCDDDAGQQVLVGRCEKCLYLVGTTYSSDFMTTPTAFQTSYAGGGDGFMLKLNVEPGLLIQASGSTTILTGGSVSLGVVPAPIYSTFGWLQWYRNGRLIPGATATTYAATTPGRYYLVGNNANPDCPTQYSNVIEVKYACSDDPRINTSTYFSGRPYRFPAGVTTITTTASYSGYAFGTVIVSSGATVNILNTTILAQSCSQIIVERGGILRVTGCTIQGCADWRGITVYGDPAQPHSVSGVHGELYLKDCTISDADVAVYSIDGGFIDVRSTVFFDNRHCIAMAPYAFSHLSPIRDSWFDAPDVSSYACFTPPFAAADRPMIYCNGITDMQIENNKFYGDFFNPAVSAVNGLEAHNSNLFHVFDNRFEGALQTGVYFSTTSSMVVRSNQVGVSLAMHPENGIIFSQSSNDIIDLNTLSRCNNGLQYYTAASGPNTLIEKNLFQDGTMGLVISTNEHPVGAAPGVNSTTSTLDISIYCNKFIDNYTGILGSGNIIAQGSMADEANNMFSLNRNWDLLWQGAAGTNFYQGSTVNGSLALNTGSSVPYTMNGIVQSSNSIAVQLNTATASNCRGSWLVTSAAEPGSNSEQFRVYPNPFTDELTVDLNDPMGDAHYTVQFVDLMGHVVYRAELNPRSTRIAPTIPAAGLYIVQIYKDGREIGSVPAVKLGE